MKQTARVLPTLLGAVLSSALVAAPIVRAQDEDQSDAVLAAPQTVEPILVDEFGRIGDCDMSARTDNLVMMLQNHPNSKAHIIVYGGHNLLPSAYHLQMKAADEPQSRYAARLQSRYSSYLIRTRSLESDKIVFVDGGFRSEVEFELWIVPRKGAPPPPTPAEKPLDSAEPTKTAETVEPKDNR